ncbi:putative nucleotide-binding domain containing protein [Botrytis fragariae]|uniref:Putative nucleotide-binding domain containing protein n=1 Tax=Botrytis fragariae TaxID=1964551 RepID=A0A8H6AW83_9HELO|nr:putative nucleotide-binding domain containing protein [Botrytis fragariae]KAF5874708.1 putative nucleotide-binding domain containing protein [Botrytis fragariae]
MSPIPITILTGFLGSGKTTLILNLLPQLHALNPSYRLALLKNEFGDLAVDSQLASSSSITSVREMLNGCICCNLVGSLSSALQELQESLPVKVNESTGKEEKGSLDRIIIETSGSAFPATLAMEVNRIARETKGAYVLDGVISVIDVENWEGYEDTSYTARLQAKYTDLVVFNKWEGVSERRFDECLDRLGDLEVQVAWVKSDKGSVGVDVVCGVDGGLARGLIDDIDGKENGHSHDHKNGDHKHEHSHDHQSEVEVLSITLASSSPSSTISLAPLNKLLTKAPKDEVYRIKAVLSSSSPIPPSDSSLSPPESDISASPSSSNSNSDLTPKSAKYILNWAFGRWTSTKMEEQQLEKEHESSQGEGVVLRMTIVTARDESNKWKKRIEGGGWVEVDGGEGDLKVVRIL